MKAIKYALLGLAGVIGMLVSMFGPVKVPFAEGLAKTYYRYALGAVLFILLLILATAGLFIATFDANNFKSEIIRFVKARTQRDLMIDGSIKVTFFPKLGLDSGRATLNQRNSAKEFASVNNARLYIAWLPLFKRQLVFDRVEIDGIHANVVRLRDGTTNFDDLLISDNHLSPLTLDIDGVRITGSSINWQDELESQRLSLHDLQLETGRLADTVPSNLTASFRLDSEQARLSAMVQLKSRLFFDRKAGRYEFANLEGKLQGGAGPVSNLALDFKCSLDSYPAQGSLTAEEIVVSGTGKLGQRDLAVKLALPGLKITRDTYTGENLALDASLSQPNEISSVSLQLPVFEISSRTFSAAELSADFDYKGDARMLHARLTSPLSINFESAPKFQLGGYALALNGKHPVLSGEVSANVTGNMDVDYAAQNVKLDFVALMDDNKITGGVSMRDFDHPAYTFEISARQLDMDRYIAADWIRRFRDDATPFAPTGLKDVTLHGNLRAGVVNMAKIKASKLTAGIKVEQSTLTIAPLAAKLQGGTFSGSVSVAMQDTPQVTVKQNLKGLQMSELLADTASADKLTGKGDFAIDISATGNSIGSLRKSLTGRASLVLSRGSLAGIDLYAALLDGKSDLKSVNAVRIRDAKFSEKTGFSELHAIFNFKDGSAIGNSFEMKSPLFRTAGQGDIALDSGDISYRLDTTVSSAISRRTAGELAEFRGITVPIRVDGHYAAPSIALDFGSASGGNIAMLRSANTDKAAAQTIPATPRAQTSKPALKHKEQK